MPGSEWRLHRHNGLTGRDGGLLGAGFMLAEKNASIPLPTSYAHKTSAVLFQLRQLGGFVRRQVRRCCLYDLTSTYFESATPDDDNDKQTLRYSRTNAGDCVQVVIALIRSRRLASAFL